MLLLKFNRGGYNSERSRRKPSQLKIQHPLASAKTYQLLIIYMSLRIIRENLCNPWEKY